VNSRTLTPVEGQLAATFREAMRLSDQMKAQGATREERDAFVAKALQAAWPKGREQPWHYLCEVCGDSGWRIRTCVAQSCGRPFKLPGQASDDHTGQGTCGPNHNYAEPCWCAKGRIQRECLFKQRAPEDVMARAAKTSKPTKVGR
jgi:hypothetical protein